jgi:hypothetical protein
LSLLDAAPFGPLIGLQAETPRETERHSASGSAGRRKDLIRTLQAISRLRPLTMPDESAGVKRLWLTIASTTICGKKVDNFQSCASDSAQATDSVAGFFRRRLEPPSDAALTMIAEGGKMADDQAKYGGAACSLC